MVNLDATWNCRSMKKKQGIEHIDKHKNDYIWKLKKGGRNNVHPPSLPPGKGLGMMIACQALCPCHTEAFNPRTQRGSERVSVASKRIDTTEFLHVNQI